jgi:hypothetical protein
MGRGLETAAPQTCDIAAAARVSVRLMLFFPPIEGVARRMAQTDSVRDPFGTAAGAFRRATCASSACYLRRLWSAPGPALRPKAFPETPRHVETFGRRAASVAGYGRAVRQLSTGTLSSPGGNPGAARVLMLRAHEPAGAAPRPAFMTPHENAPQRTR